MPSVIDRLLKRLAEATAKGDTESMNQVVKELRVIKANLEDALAKARTQQEKGGLQAQLTKVDSAIADAEQAVLNGATPDGQPSRGPNPL